MKIIVLVICLFSSSVSFAAQKLDCRNPGNCLVANSSLDFGEIRLLDIEEEWKTHSWGTKYREINLTVSASFATLIDGTPILGKDHMENGAIAIFVLAPVSDLTAPSLVTGRFTIHAGAEKRRIFFYSGSLRSSSAVLLGDF